MKFGIYTLAVVVSCLGWRQLQAEERGQGKKNEAESGLSESIMAKRDRNARSARKGQREREDKRERRRNRGAGGGRGRGDKEPPARSPAEARVDNGSRGLVLPGKILGTLVSENRGKSIIFFKKSKGLKLLKIGDRIGGKYTVVDIQRRFITFRNKGVIVKIHEPDY